MTSSWRLLTNSFRFSLQSWDLMSQSCDHYSALNKLPYSQKSSRRGLVFIRLIRIIVHCFVCFSRNIETGTKLEICYTEVVFPFFLTSTDVLSVYIMWLVTRFFYFSFLRSELLSSTRPKCGLWPAAQSATSTLSLLIQTLWVTPDWSERFSLINWFMLYNRSLNSSAEEEENRLAREELVVAAIT